MAMDISHDDDWAGRQLKSAKPRRIEVIDCDHQEHRLPLQVKGSIKFEVRIRTPVESETVDWEERQVHFTAGRSIVEIDHSKRVHETIGDGEVRDNTDHIGHLRIRPFTDERHAGRVFTVQDRPKNLVTMSPYWELTDKVMSLHGHVQLGDSVRFDTYPAVVRLKGGHRGYGDVYVTAGMEGVDIWAERKGGDPSVFWRVPYDKIDRFPLDTSMGWQDLLVKRYGAGTGYFLEREMAKVSEGYQYADSYRVAEKGESWEEDDFDKNRGCCGQKEWTVKDPKTGRVFRLGFNYGH